MAQSSHGSRMHAPTDQQAHDTKQHAMAGSNHNNHDGNTYTACTHFKVRLLLAQLLCQTHTQEEKTDRKEEAKTKHGCSVQGCSKEEEKNVVCLSTLLLLLLGVLCSLLAVFCLFLLCLLPPAADGSEGVVMIARTPVQFACHSQISVKVMHVYS